MLTKQIIDALKKEREEVIKVLGNLNSIIGQYEGFKLPKQYSFEDLHPEFEEVHPFAPSTSEVPFCAPNFNPADIPMKSVTTNTGRRSDTRKQTFDESGKEISFLSQVKNYLEKEKRFMSCAEVRKQFPNVERKNLASNLSQLKTKGVLITRHNGILLEYGIPSLLKEEVKSEPKTKVVTSDGLSSTILQLFGLSEKFMSTKQMCTLISQMCPECIDDVKLGNVANVLSTMRKDGELAYYKPKSAFTGYYGLLFWLNSKGEIKPERMYTIAD